MYACIFFKILCNNNLLILTGVYILSTIMLINVDNIRVFKWKLLLFTWKKVDFFKYFKSIKNTNVNTNEYLSIQYTENVFSVLVWINFKIFCPRLQLQKTYNGPIDFLTI